MLHQTQRSPEYGRHWCAGASPEAAERAASPLVRARLSEARMTDDEPKGAPRPEAGAADVSVGVRKIQRGSRSPAPRAPSL
jgi:hypothetical protein